MIIKSCVFIPVYYKGIGTGKVLEKHGIKDWIVCVKFLKISVLGVPYINNYFVALVSTNVWQHDDKRMTVTNQ